VNSEAIDISPWREVKLKFLLFPEWDRYKDGDYQEAVYYVHGTFQNYIKSHWKKRTAKKIIQQGVRLRGRIFKEYRDLNLQLCALKIFAAFKEEGLSRKILPPVTVELIEDPPPNNTL
jgi:hypothetical protein